MATRQMFEEVLADEFSSEAQKDQAQAGLYRLDNPNRDVSEDPIAENPTATPKLGQGLWWEGLGPLLRDDYFAAKRKADPSDPQRSVEALHEFERITFPEVYAKQMKGRDDADTLSVAKEADLVARREHLFVQHPSWRRPYIHVATTNTYPAGSDADDFISLCNALAERGVEWKLIEGIATKFQHGKVVPIVMMPAAAAIAASGGKVVDGTCRKSV